MAMTNFVVTPPRGNILFDMRIQRHMPRPHMYMDKEGCVTIKEKLDYKDKMSYVEFMAAYTAMLQDFTLVQPEDWPFLHFQQDRARRNNLVRHGQDAL